jgi:hypothetical protein
MLSCLSNSYSLSKYNNPGTVGTVFTPFTFSYSDSQTGLIFTNNDNKAPVTISNTETVNELYVSSLNPLKFNQDTFTIYIKHKFITSITNNQNHNIMFFQANYQGQNNLLTIFRLGTPNTSTVKFRCIKNGNTILDKQISISGAYTNNYLHFFIKVKPDPTTNASTLEYYAYDTLGTLLFNTGIADISDIGNAFTNLPAQFRMTNNNGLNFTAPVTYNKAGWYNKYLLPTECVDIIAESPT